MNVLERRTRPAFYWEIPKQTSSPVELYSTETVCIRNEFQKKQTAQDEKSSDGKRARTSKRNLSVCSNKRKNLCVCYTICVCVWVRLFTSLKFYGENRAIQKHWKPPFIAYIVIECNSLSYIHSWRIHSAVWRWTIIIILPPPAETVNAKRSAP